MRPNVTAWHPGLHTLLTRMAVGGLLVLSGATAAYAGPENGPTLSVIGGTGIPGGTVNVKFALSNDPNNLACAAGITVTFDPDILVFTGGARPPRCTVDPRLSSSHVIQGPGESEPGVFDADVFANPAGENSPMGNGNIAMCAFNIDVGAPVGTTALTLEMPPDSFLNNCQGVHISPATFISGEVVVALATPTFTVTATPTTRATSTRTVVISPTATRTVSATSTRTAGSPTATSTGGTATPTATVSATSTRTVGTGTPTNTVSPIGTVTNTVGTPSSTSTITTTPRITATATRTGGVVNTPTRTAQKSSEDDGCNIVAPEQAGSSAGFLLLAPALLLWMRRRRF